MYIMGGFDGSRLNDVYQIALPHMLREEDGEVSSSHNSFQSMRVASRPSSRPPTSGNMQTVPSDMPVDEDDVKDTLDDTIILHKKVSLLQKQVDELSKRLKNEEERNDMCKICFSREIDTVFLECAHRVSCL